MKHVEPSYGYYPGGDPRKFDPDPECCTPAERARYDAACAAWERGETPDPGGPHIPLGTPVDPESVVATVSNRLTGHGHMTVAHYGLGTYEFEWDCDDDDECVLCCRFPGSSQDL